MKFSLPSRRSSKARQKQVQALMDRVQFSKKRSKAKLPQAKRKLKSISIDWTIVVLAWAIATGLGSVAWAFANYLIEREKQRTQRELARLERKAKKKGS